VNWFLVAVLVDISCALLCALLAMGTRRSARDAFWVGLIFGPLGLLVVILLLLFTHPDEQPPKTKHLNRSREHRVLAGVCGGMSERYGISPTVLRVLVVLLSVFRGIGIGIYLGLWLGIPSAPAVGNQIRPRRHSRDLPG
jgi:phage shock protein PspC (stress-responsive transcriptional regulator)